MTTSKSNRKEERTIGATIYSVSFTNIYSAEKLIFLPMQFVFDKEELENIEENIIKKYKLNPYFRDIKYAKKDDFPSRFPTSVLKFNEDGFCPLISIRAMHRICVSELFDKKIHFLFNKYLKEKMLTYDNEHGCIIKSRLNKKIVGVNYNYTIISKNAADESIKVNGLHTDFVSDVEGKPGLLVYYFTGEKIDTIYLSSADTQNFVIGMNQ